MEKQREPTHEQIAREAARELKERCWLIQGITEYEVENQVTAIIQSAIPKATEATNEFWRARIRDGSAGLVDAVTRAAQPQREPQEHESGCLAQGGYGHGPEPCICKVSRPSDGEWTEERLREYVTINMHTTNLTRLSQAINASLAAEQDKRADWNVVIEDLEKALAAEREKREQAEQAASDFWQERQEARKERNQLREQLAGLEGWKKSQMLVAADTHYHEIAKEIGLTLGTYIAPEILPWIRKTKEQLAAAQSAIESVKLICDHEIERNLRWAIRENLKHIDLSLLHESQREYAQPTVDALKAIVVPGLPGFECAKIARAALSKTKQR